MRRVIVLVLLLLSPLEVLAGLVHGPMLMNGTQTTTWFLSSPALIVHDAPASTNLSESESHSEGHSPREETLPALGEVSLDLGEALDIVGRLALDIGHFTTSPPTPVTDALSSVVLEVPPPPVVRLVQR